MTSTRRARQGMTLMELVIGLAITGMMAAAGAGAFSAIIDHREVIRRASVSTERGAALRDMIHTWIAAGTINIQIGGGPRGLLRGAPISSQPGSNTASVSAAQAIGDELMFTTSALNPSMLPNVRMRLFIDGDPNTPEKGLTIEYQPSSQMPIVRKMLDSTIDSLRVEYLDSRTRRWFPASQVATLSGYLAVRLTLVPDSAAVPRPSPILSVPMIFANPAAITVTNTNR